MFKDVLKKLKHHEEMYFGKDSRLLDTMAERSGSVRSVLAHLGATDPYSVAALPPVDPADPTNPVPIDPAVPKAPAPVYPAAQTYPAPVYPATPIDPASVYPAAPTYPAVPKVPAIYPTPSPLQLKADGEGQLDIQQEKAIRAIAAQLEQISVETPFDSVLFDQLDDVEKQLLYLHPTLASNKLGEINTIRKKLRDTMFPSEFHAKFTPIKIIGQGGFGTVLEAEFRLIETNYAIKRIPLEGSKPKIQIALEEVKRLALFEHTGIVRYHNAWIESPHAGWQIAYDSMILMKMGYDARDNRDFLNYDDKSVFLYIQMELGKMNLTDWLNSNDVRDPIKMKSWFKQIVSAVDYIHKKNTIHRDLKPSNILVISDDVVKICDLGISTTFERGEGALTMRTYIGTILYKAPEQGTIYDHRVDIFSLGLILLEMSVLMTDTQRSEAVFTDIRCAKQLSVLQNQPNTLDLVTKLTKLDRDLRPSTDELLGHPFFSE